MLVTGGYGNKQNAKAFEFNEDIWSTISQELKDFLTKCLVFDPTKRATVDDLLASVFVMKASSQTFSTPDSFPTRLSSAGFNLYQFQWANCFNAIVCKD